MDKNEAEDKANEVRQEALKKLDTSKFKYHRLSTDECLKELNVNKTKGLDNSEIAKRLEKYGANELDKEEETTLWERIKE